MNPSLLKPLLAGEYICPVRFHHEFESLQDAKTREEVDAWLRKLGYRLSRIGDEGAFFMSQQTFGPKEVKQVRDELLRFRDEYGPYVELLNFVRQSKPDYAALSTGTVVQLAELSLAVSDSASLEMQLRSLVRLIHAGAERLSNHENLRRLCEHLVKDGYFVVKDKQSEVYRVTGKIEQLYAVLQYLDEHSAIPDVEVDDQLGGNQEELLTTAASVAEEKGEQS